MHDLYPEGELTPTLLAIPPCGPKVGWSSTSVNTYVSSESSSTVAQRRKHESYMLTGSVFLVTGNGQTLKLPTLSDSPADPLGWSVWKRAGAFLAVAWFSIVALAVAPAAGIFFRVMARDFAIDVS
jgi:hypothetical protein